MKIKKPKFKKIHLQQIIMTLFILAIVVVVKREFQEINFKTYRSLILNLSIDQRAMLVLVGLVTFLFALNYDFILAKKYAPSLRRGQVLKIAWISEGFNNFVGFGGLTGTGLRARNLKRYDIPGEKIFSYSLGAALVQILGLCIWSLPSVLIVRRVLPRGLVFIALMWLYLPLFLFYDRLPRGKYLNKFYKKVPLELDLKTRGKLALASIFDWGAAGLCFIYGLHFFTSFNVMEVLSLYFVASLVGVLSFIPGGLGSFDLALLLLLEDAGIARSIGMSALLLYRIHYYIIPWLIATFMVLNEEWEERTEDPELFNERLTIVISIGTFITGVVLCLASITPNLVERVRLLHDFIPVDTQQNFGIMTGLLGVALIQLSQKIGNLTKRVFRVSFLALGAGALFTILHGLNFEDALLLAVFGMLFLKSRHAFNYPRDEFKWREFFKNLGIMSLLFILVRLLHYYANFYSGAARMNLGTFIMTNFSRPFTPHLFVMIPLFSYLLSTLNRKKFVENEISDEIIAEFEEVTRDMAYNDFTHLFYLRDKLPFYNKAKTVFMQYATTASHLVVLGDPIGREEDFTEAIEEITEFARKNQLKICFYEVLGSNLEYYAEFGFSFIKFGEEAVVDLKNFTFEGKKNKNLRIKYHRYEKAGYYLKTVNPPFDPAFLDELEVISNRWLGSRKELHFSLGSFNRTYLQTSPIVLICRPDDQILGFCNLMPNKNTRNFSIDLMRYLPSEDNVMEAMFILLMVWAKEAGYEFFNLGMAPLSNVARTSSAGYKERILNMVYHTGKKVYNFKGLRQFKEKFHPHWQSRYLVYQGERELPELLLSLYQISHQPMVKEKSRVTLESFQKKLNQ